MKYVVMILFGWVVGVIYGFVLHCPPIASALAAFFSSFFAKFVYEVFFE